MNDNNTCKKTQCLAYYLMQRELASAVEDARAACEQRDAALRLLAQAEQRIANLKTALKRAKGLRTAHITTEKAA